MRHSSALMSVLLVAATSPVQAFQPGTVAASALLLRPRPGVAGARTGAGRAVCCAGGGGENGEKYRNPVVEALGTLLPTAKQQDAPCPIDGIDFGVEKRAGMTASAMAEALEEGLSAREWFVTGLVLPELFSDRFAFQVRAVSRSISLKAKCAREKRRSARDRKASYTA
jgi:hypothetical protein